MGTSSWVKDLDKQERKNWVTIGCALNITQKGLAPQIQKSMEDWYKSLISTSPLQSLPLCSCRPGGGWCATCTTWKTELKGLHNSQHPKICWDNSDRKQWGSPTGAWEIAKVFMPALGKRKRNVINANTTDISGLLNLLKWCPFIASPIKKKILDAVLDTCRNKWAHAANHELSDADIKTIFGHLRSLLNESVLSGDKDAQSSSKDLKDLERAGLVNVVSPEIEALRLLRLLKEDDVSSIREILDQMENDMDEVKEQGLKTKEDLAGIEEQFLKLVKEITDLKENIGAISNIIEDLNKLRNESEQYATKSQVASLQKEVMEVMKEVNTMKEKSSEGPKGDLRRSPFFTPSQQTAFTGRKSALKWLEQNLIPPGHSPGNSHKNDRRTKAVCGLGGCGKTALTVEFAWMNKDYFPGGVFWINGESDDNIRKSVIEMLISLKIPLPTSDIAALSTLLSWLADNEFPWLLVVDNTDEFTDPVCPTGVKTIFHGPWKRNGKAPENGCILLTTRQNTKDTEKFLKLSPADCLNLQCLDEKEAASFLMRSMKPNPVEKSPDPNAIHLAKELGCLPLALKQAAAFMSSSGCSFQDYLQRYQDRKLELLKKHEPITTLSGEEAGHRLSVHTTWLLNFESVSRHSKAAAKVMHLASFLNPRCIPVEVINPGCPELEDNELRENARSEVEVAPILMELSRYSLFSVSDKTKVISVHNLVQDVVRDNLKPSERTETFLTAVRVLHYALQKKEEKLMELSNFFAFGKMSEEMKKESDIIIGLLSNLRPLRVHMERELTSSPVTSEIPLFLIEGLSLFSFACDSMKNIVFFNELQADLSQFQLKFVRMYSSKIDPDLLLKVMVFASQGKRNSLPEEAEKLAEEAVQKLIEIEDRGHSIEIDTKFAVRQNRASFQAPRRCYEELLELEGLQISEANVADLNISIANAARRVLSPDNFESVLSRYETALEIVRKIYPSDHPELLRVLQLITTYLYQEHKVKDALPYTEEMIKFVNSLPKESDWFIKGLISALKVLSVFDPCNSYARLVDIFADRWPSLYTLVIQKKEIDASAINEAVGCGGSEEHLLEVIEGLGKCFSVIFRNCPYEEWLSGNHHVNFCKRVVEMKKLVVEKRRDSYGRKCLPTEDHMSFRPLDVREFMADFPVVSKDQYDKMESLLPEGLNTNNALQHHKRGEELFLKGNFLEALECYDQFLALSSGKQEIAEAYYRKAVCLAHCDKRSPSLAAAALAKTLASRKYANIQEVVEKFGCYDTEIVRTCEDLLRATERSTNNLVIVMMKGKYHLTEPLKLQRNTVVVGYGNVRITTSAKSVPLQGNSTTFVEGVTQLPSTEKMAKQIEDANERLNCGELDDAVAIFTKALTQESTDFAEILAWRATAYLKCAKREENDASTRHSFLEKALSDSEAAIAADSICLHGYFNKATSLAEQERKDEAIVAAALFNYLSQGENVPEVTKRYGEIHVFESTRADDLPDIIASFVCKKFLKKVVVKKDDSDSVTTFSPYSKETPDFKINFFEFATLVAAARMLMDINNFSDKTLQNCDDAQIAAVREGSSPSRIILIKDGRNFLVSAVVIGEGRLLVHEIEKCLPSPQEFQRSLDSGSREPGSELNESPFNPTDDERASFLHEIENFLHSSQVFQRSLGFGSREPESELDESPFRSTNDERAFLLFTQRHLSQTDTIYLAEGRHSETALSFKNVIVCIFVLLIFSLSIPYNVPGKQRYI